jgi:hypothetical protein
VVSTVRRPSGGSPASQLIPFHFFAMASAGSDGSPGTRIPRAALRIFQVTARRDDDVFGFVAQLVTPAALGQV